ncbi:helicase HerA domain-containing protein [Aureimonas ureilytica]|uniref:helicase HerA domain-containing protein n=1 Tax=Aureimonas ureilytica TaxID=401562 RepID=UPI00128F7F81|nr:DUF87 domain-containing protein [Aureimonas ureilytica]
MAALDNLVAQRRAYVIDTARQLLTNQPVANYFHETCPVSFDEFVYLVENHEKARAEWLRTRTVSYLGMPIGGSLLQTLKPSYTPTAQDWQRYLIEHFPTMQRLLPPMSISSGGFREEVRQEHTLIVAGAGSGKSTIIKKLAHHYVANTTSSVVLLDPHSDLVQDMHIWPEFANSDRLILIEAGRFPGETVGINLLDGRGMDLDARNKAALTFTKLMVEYTGDLSPNMNLVVGSCAEVLLGVVGATINDLILMLKVPEKPKRGEDAPPLQGRAAELMGYALNHPRPSLRNWFRDEFDTQYIAITRNSLRSRLQILIRNMAVEAMLTGGPSTIDLEAALNSGKVVLIDLLSFGEDAVRPLGLFFVAMITAIASKRRDTPSPDRVPIHLFIDEVTELASKEVVRVVNALRKYGVHATFAQQSGGQGFEGSDLKEALFESTAIKILASDRPEQYAKLAKIDPDHMPPRGKKQFWVKWGKDSDVEIKVVETDPRFADQNHRSTAGELAETLKRLRDRDYRPMFEAAPAPRRHDPEPTAPELGTSEAGSVETSAAPHNPAPETPAPRVEPNERWRRARAMPELD